MLEIQNLNVSLDGKKLLTDINLSVACGARHLLAGHNGSGKSTLAAVIAGDSRYTIDSGKILFDGRNVTDDNATAHALAGIFLGAQSVPEIPGLTWLSFLKHSAAAHAHFQTGRDLSMGEFLIRLDEARTRLNIPKEWLNRSVNVGFSGGERKRMMLMRLVMTGPRLAILDEPDSGADTDTQRLIADTVSQMPDTTFLFISHQKTFTEMMHPTARTEMKGGAIITE